VLRRTIARPRCITGKILGRSTVHSIINELSYVEAVAEIHNEEMICWMIAGR